MKKLKNSIKFFDWLTLNTTTAYKIHFAVIIGQLILSELVELKTLAQVAGDFFDKRSLGIVSGSSLEQKGFSPKAHEILRSSTRAFHFNKISHTLGENPFVTF